MTEEAFEVRPDVLREAAGALADDAYRLAHGLAGTPGLVVPAPDWRVGVALAVLESAVHAWWGALGARVAGAAGAVVSAADSYEAVDDRAATRLAALPR